MAVQRLILRRMSLGDRTLNSLAEAMKARPYDPEEGSGFFVEEQNGTWLTAFFVTKVASRVNRFVVEEKRVVQELTQVPVVVPFSIDVATGTLDIQSTQRLGHRLIDELGALTGFSCTIEELVFDPIQVIRALQKSGKSPEVTRVKIKDFVLRDGVVGDVTFRVAGAGEGVRLAEEWWKAVQAVTITLTSRSGAEVQITVSRGGTISISADSIDHALLHEIKTDLVVGG